MLTESGQPAARYAEAGDAASPWRAVTAFALVFIAAKLVLLAVLALDTQYLMDEYAMARHALLVDQNPYRDVWPHKTLFYAYFYRIAFWLGEDSVGVMEIARVQTLVVAFAALALLYGIARAIGRTRVEALLVLCVTLGFSSFMERAFTVRPETLALLFALGALWVACRDSRSRNAWLIAGLLSGAAFLTTQKAVYFNLALGVALVGEGLLRRSPRAAFASGALLVLGWAVMLGAYVGAFALNGADAGDTLRQIFLGPPTENVAEGHKAYQNLRLYLWQTFIRNVPQYGLCLVGWVLAAWSLGERPGGERVALIFAGAISVLVFGVHAAPWPYNFILAIPFLALWSPLVLEALARVPARRKALIAAIILAVLGLSGVRNLRYLEHDNGYQNETVRLAESLLQPGESYFDGVHMVVTRPHATDIWLQNSVVQGIRRAAKRGDFAILESVFARAPKVVILSYRSEGIAAALAPYVDESYLPVAPNVLLSGARLEAGEARAFHNRWPGTYRLYDAAGAPRDAAYLLDGRRLSGAVELAAGRHQVRLAGTGGPLYLLPANLAVPVAVLPAPEQRPLFHKAHSF